MWLKIPESRLCPNCEVPTEHWVLYGQSGRIVGEATFCPICYPDVRDVFEEEPPKDNKLLKLKNVQATPHIGAQTHEAQSRAGLLIAKKVIEALEKSAS